ncbi:hypothetical protein D3C72_2347930 [compost metagenome]
MAAINKAKQGSAMANRSAVAVKGGMPAPMILLAMTVLPTSAMAAARKPYPHIRWCVSIAVPCVENTQRRTRGRCRS